MCELIEGLTNAQLTTIIWIRSSHCGAMNSLQDSWRTQDQGKLNGDRTRSNIVGLSGFIAIQMSMRPGVNVTTKCTLVIHGVCTNGLTNVPSGAANHGCNVMVASVNMPLHLRRFQVLMT